MSQFPPHGNQGLPAYDEPMLVAEPPGWPKVVGIISIVWGGLGVFCTGCGLAALGIQRWALAQAQQSPGGGGANMPQLPDVMMPQAPQYVQIALGGLLAIFLIFAGIATLRRSAAGRSMHLVYAVLGLCLVVFGLVIGIQQNMAMAQYFNDNPGDPAKKFYNPMAQVGGMIFGIVLGAAWPIFCGIWFGLVKRTHQSMMADPQA